MKTGMVILTSVLCLVETVTASSFFKGRLQPKENNPAVSVVIMKWGLPPDGGGHREGATDIVVGQIVAAGHPSVTLIFEGVDQESNKPVTVTFDNIPVQRYMDNDRETFSRCRQCGRQTTPENKRGVLAKGAIKGKGCYFWTSTPHQPGVIRLRLIDVQSSSGESLYYFVKFNVSLDLLRSGMAISLAKGITVHEIPPPRWQSGTPDEAAETAEAQELIGRPRAKKYGMDDAQQQTQRQTVDDSQAERLRRELELLKTEVRTVKNNNPRAGEPRQIESIKVTRVSPLLGPPGQWVYIDGTFGSEGIEVFFNDVRASRVAVYKAGSLGVSVPDVRNGEATVTVKTPDGQASYSGTYVVGVPTGRPKITGLSPQAGSTGKWVYIRGSAFVCGASTVSMGGKIAERVAVYGPDSIGFGVPDGLSGDVTVTVKTPNGVAESPIKFRVE